MLTVEIFHAVSLCVYSELYGHYQDQCDGSKSLYRCKYAVQLFHEGLQGDPGRFHAS